MELDFDKEIDVLLRTMPKSDADLAGQDAHLDADEISAFAENALPEKAKKRYVTHLADCDLCRKNLSELILLNAKNEPEIVAEKEEITTVAPVLIPWYRKLFAFPNLAYTMGALVLAFVGLTAFIVLQNFNSTGSDVARSSNTNSIERSNAPNLNETSSANSNTNMAAATSNSAVSNVSNSNMAANTTVTAPERSPEIYNTNKVQPQSLDDILPSPEFERNEKRADPNDLDLAKSKTQENADAAAASQPLGGVPVETRNTAPIIAETQSAPKPAATPAPKTSTERDKVLTRRGGDEEVLKDDKSNPERKLKKESFSNSRKVSGKTFNRREGVWYDSAYRNQPTTNVGRNTNEYQKLDSGLRSIGNQLGGVVVVVWKAKAYRIE